MFIYILLLDSEQGLWCKYSNIKDDIITIDTNEDIIKLVKNDEV
jgi:hypothetical protein